MVSGGVESAGGERRQSFYCGGRTRRGATRLRQHSSPGIERAGQSLRTSRTNIFRFRLARAWPITPCSAKARLSRRSIRRTLLCIRRIRMACSALKCGPMGTASSSCARARRRSPRRRESPTSSRATWRRCAVPAPMRVTRSAAAPERDDWDRWNSDRDRMIHNADAWRHTNKYYVGSEDLDANGQWEDAPDYGQVWVPNEPDGWAPYRDGNWVWEPYYGWTWVGYEPWGWAPYHYGRWMWYGGAWAWWPGPVWGAGFYRPFWAPAYVSFFGFGGGFGFGFGFGWGGWGGFGWLPIGPCDRFFPWWGGYGGRFGVVGFNRFGGLNRFGGIAPLHGGTQFSNLAHINDAHIGGAVSTVGAGKFGAGRTTAVAATHEQLSSARMMTGNLPVVPSRASLSASGRAAAPSTIHNSASQHFFGTQSSVAAGIVPAADSASAAVHAAEPLQPSDGWTGHWQWRDRISVGRQLRREGSRARGRLSSGREMSNAASRGASESCSRPAEVNRTAVSGRRLRRHRTAASRRAAAEAAPRRRAAARVAATGTAQLRVRATHVVLVRAAMGAAVIRVRSLT